MQRKSANNGSSIFLRVSLLWHLKYTLDPAACAATLDASNVPQLLSAHSRPNGGISGAYIEVARILLPLHRSMLPGWRVPDVCGAPSLCFSHMSSASDHPAMLLVDFLL